PRLRRHGYAQGGFGSRPAGPDGAAPASRERCCIRLSGTARRQVEAALLGRPGVLPLLQDSRARPFPLAVGSRRHGPTDVGPACDAVGRDRLETAELGCAAGPRRVTFLSRKWRFFWTFRPFLRSKGHAERGPRPP